jgi:hypothetical protein
MVHQYDEIALCSTVLGGKVRYFKEYSLNGRIVDTECIPYSEFVRLLYLSKMSGELELERI